MLKTEELEPVEQPGPGAIDHPCEMKVESPEEEGQLRKCGILALEQCHECTAWICGTEGLDHCIICVRCGERYCPEHYAEHRLARNCEQRDAA